MTKSESVDIYYLYNDWHRLIFVEALHGENVFAIVCCFFFLVDYAHVEFIYKIISHCDYVRILGCGILTLEKIVLIQINMGPL